MRLVLREYLSMLKESGELDSLLPDLLLAMDLDPLSRPERGTRQFGVDLPAVGVDTEDGRRKLFLFLIKQGDITRSNWDSGAQAVRPSLNEIFDVYLRTQVRPEYSSLPKKIILVTNGELRQNVEPNWAGYARERSGIHAEHGEIQLEFWSADRLALLLDQYLLDEYLFPESAQKQIRKTIALADQNEDEPRYFYALIEETLSQRNLPTENTAGALRKRQHALRLLNLSANIVFHWCKEADNLRPALLCVERLLLRVWDWMRERQLFDASTREEFTRLFSTYLSIAFAYAIKVAPHCLVRDGLSGYSGDEAEYQIRTFEVVGILGLLCLALDFLEENREEANQSFLGIGQALSALPQTNPSALTPCFDGHSIDIGLGLLALKAFGAKNQAIAWLNQLSHRVLMAYRIGRHFPISSDSYDDLVALRFGENSLKEPLREFSSLVPLLADWFAVLDLPEEYQAFREAVAQILPGTDLQMWFPDGGTEENLYRCNASSQGGTVFGSIKLPETLDGLKERMARLLERSSFGRLSCIEQGWPIVGLIASRHFRTPLIPEYWQLSVCQPTVTTDAGSDGP